MTRLITSNGSALQEKIVRVALAHGYERALTGYKPTIADELVAQWPADRDLPLEQYTNVGGRVIIWIHQLAAVRHNKKRSVRALRKAAAIIVPAVSAAAWLVRHGIASARIVLMPFATNSTACRADRALPPFSTDLRTWNGDLAGVPAVMADRLNIIGGLGLVDGNQEEVARRQMMGFISAGLPVVTTPTNRLATVVRDQQIGFVWSQNEINQRRTQLSPAAYQIVAQRVHQVAAHVAADDYIQWALTTAEYQGVVGAVDVTADQQRFDLRVMDSLATLDYIDRFHPSVARFGDGEVSLLNGVGQVFQDPDPELAKRLNEILHQQSSPRLLICLSDTFHDQRRYPDNVQGWWQNHQDYFADYYRELGQHGHFYGNTMVTRPYIDLQDRNQAPRIFKRIKRWWQDRDILLVEGAYTRSGVGNDLYANARSVRRVLCPAKNAWAKHEQIEEAIKKYGEGRLVLVMLGMAATVIAADLSSWGQVIDLGHLDTEYEWYQRGAVKREKIPGKHTAEMNYDQGIPAQINDQAYQDQVVLDLSK